MAKSKLDEAVKRRVRAGRLLLAGKSPPEVARLLGAPRQTVYRWRDVLKASGIDALRDMSKGGRPPQLGAAELSPLHVALLEGAPATASPHRCGRSTACGSGSNASSAYGTARCTSGACSGNWVCPTRSTISALWSATPRPSSTGASALGRR